MVIDLLRDKGKKARNLFKGNQEPHFAPLHAYIKEQFGEPREAAKQFQEIMDEMMNMATMKDEYVCLSAFRFATMYGHLQLLRDALEECAARNAYKSA